MTDGKKTNIIAITDFSEFGNSAVLHAASLSKVFKSSLTIVTHFSFSASTEKKTESIDPILTEQLAVLSDNGEIRWDSKSYNLKSIYRQAESTNTIMFVIGVSRKRRQTFFHLRNAIRFIKPSRLPVMTVGKYSPSANAWQHVMMPMDIDRQSKEKALWAGYFNRFGGATVHVLHTIFKDTFLKEKLADSISFTEKLYQNLSIQYELHEITPTIDNMDDYSLQFASKIDATLTVIMMTKYYTFVDFLLGTKEKRIIANEFNIPVLCINERDDLYVLCT